MISPLMASSKNVQVSQKRCLGTSIERFTGSSLNEQIISDCKPETRVHAFSFPGDFMPIPFP